MVSPKLLDHYTIWDLMLQKGKINAAVGTGVMETILNDINAVLGEMKLLVDSCLKPVRLGKVQINLKKKRRVGSERLCTQCFGFLFENVQLLDQTHHPKTVIFLFRCIFKAFLTTKAFLKYVL